MAAAPSAAAGSTCPAAAVGDTPADQADRSRLAGLGIEVVGIAGSQSMRGLGGWEAGRRGCFAVVAAALVVA